MWRALRVRSAQYNKPLTMPSIKNIFATCRDTIIQTATFVLQGDNTISNKKRKIWLYTSIRFALATRFRLWNTHLKSLNHPPPQTTFCVSFRYALSDTPDFKESQSDLRIVVFCVVVFYRKAPFVHTYRLLRSADGWCLQVGVHTDIDHTHTQTQHKAGIYSFVYVGLFLWLAGFNSQITNI